MRALFFSAVAILFAGGIFAAEAEVFNLTATVRAEQAAGKCGAATITGVSHDKYLYVNAFDGVTNNNVGTYRWLSPNDDNPASAYAQYVAPADFQAGKLFGLSGYRLSRMFASQYDTPRTPTGWEIFGVLPSGETVKILEVTKYEWGTGDDVSVRIKTFGGVSENRFRGFRYHPLTTSSSDGVRFGLLEVEFFVSASDTDGLRITSDPGDDMSGFSPKFDAFVTTNAVCTAPAELRVNTLPYGRIGYTIEELVDGEWIGGSVTNSADHYDYDASQKGAYRLTWRYSPKYVYNLAPTVLAAGYTLTASGVSYGGYGPDKVFDGITHYENPAKPEQSDLNRRWLAQLKDNPYVRVDVDPAFRSNSELRPVAYRIWRLYDSNNGTMRWSKSWTLYGVTTTGITNVLSQVSKVTWTAGDGDEVRSRQYAIPTQDHGDYRSYIFKPTEYAGNDGYTGLFELEIFVNEASAVENSLEIASSTDLDFACDPAVGAQVTTPSTCVRTSKGYRDNRRYARKGYKLYRMVDSAWSLIEDDPAAEEFVWDGSGGVLKLEWQWGPIDGCKFDLCTYGGESFVKSSEPDALGYYDFGTTVTITPQGQTDPVSTFASWVGSGIPEGHETDNPLVLTISEPVDVRGEFNRHWKYLSDEGEILDGNWSLRVQNDTQTPIGEYVADLALSEGAYLKGLGLLDFTTMLEDTGHVLSSVLRKAMTNRVGLTGLRLPTGLRRMAAESFAYSPDLVFVEMSDTILRLDDGDSQSGNGGAFGGCPSLSTVRLSNAVTFLGHQSFGSCEALESVTPFLPSSLVTLGSAFQRCPNLTGTPDLSHVRQLINGCFHACSKLSGHVVVTNGQEVVSEYAGAFQESGITSVRLASMGLRMFYQCRSLTNVSFAAGVTHVPSLMLSECQRLERISADDAFVDLRSIGEGAFRSCSNPRLRMPLRYPSLTEIGNNAFCNVVSDGTGRFEFPAVTNIGITVFFNAGIREVDLRHSKIVDPGLGAFRYEYGWQQWPYYVKTIMLPSTVTNLANAAFADCSTGRTIHFDGLPPSVGDTTFRGVPAYGKLRIFIPSSSEKLTAWTNDTNFVALKDIPSVETNDYWSAIKDDPRLIGTWHDFWCFVKRPGLAFKLR